MSTIYQLLSSNFALTVPFNRMEPEHLQWMIERMKLCFYAKGEVIVSPEQKQVEQFYVVKQGIVYAEQLIEKSTEVDTWLELDKGECFPLGALLARRPVYSVYRAGEDTFCFQLATSDFHTLLGMSKIFSNFCIRQIANLLEYSKQVIHTQYAQSETKRHSLTSPLSSIIRRKPVSCTANTSVRKALETMKLMHIGSMIAVDEEGRPIGIMTLQDVLERIAMPQANLDQPVINLMSTTLTAVSPHIQAQQAAILMVENGVRHILVVENEKLVGLVSEKDLFALQRVGLREIGMAIRSALQVEELLQAASNIRNVVHSMMAQGVAPEHLTQFISAFNDLLTVRIIELAFGQAASIPAACQICWLALGSQGRFEQTLYTDQDNALIFTVPEGYTAEQLRTELLPIAKNINDTLALCGFPLCKGMVMASNPQWCLSLGEWKKTFANWINHCTKEAILQSSIFFDFRALSGEASLAAELREWLHELAGGNERFLYQLAEAAMDFRPPIGVIKDFVLGKEKKLDLKMYGITPFVNAARLFSLATGVPATNTIQRLRASASKMKISTEDIEAWINAFLFIQVLRLRHHDLAKANGLSDEELDNLIDPAQLNELDRRILKEAFRQARKLQIRIGLEYHV